ncbi:MAG: DinB family protein [Candidatus Sulfotelmatobacter sp.]
MKRIFVACFAGFSFFAVCLAGATPGFAQASSAMAASVKDPVSASLRMILPGRAKNTVGAIEAMPADKFSYKPTPDQMSFAHLVIHITEFNNGLCAKVADVPVAKVDELKETDSKDKLLAAAKASFDFCTAALSKMDDSKLGDSVEFFGGHQFPRAWGALVLSGGWSDHYASAAMYLRLNGVLPPSAQPKK